MKSFKRLGHFFFLMCISGLRFRIACLEKLFIICFSSSFFYICTYLFWPAGETDLFQGSAFQSECGSLQNQSVDQIPVLLAPVSEQC